MPIKILSPEEVRRACDPASFSFETTADLPYTEAIFGQPRATRAIDFGVNMDAPGYNLFVMGPQGTGRTHAVERYLKRTAPQGTQPGDWAYVHNFNEPRKPVALRLKAGCARQLRELMNGLMRQVQAKLPAAFETDAYDEAADRIATALQIAQNEALAKVQAACAKEGFDLSRTASGLAIVPDKGTELDEDKLRAQAHLNDMLGDTLRVLREMDKQARDALGQLDADVAHSVVKPMMEDAEIHLDELAAQADKPALSDYLRAVEQDIVWNVGVFKPVDRGGLEIEPAARRIFMNRYLVNMLVDNCETCGAPIISEDFPTYYNLVGRIDRTLSFSNAGNSIDHMMLRPGALHRANGGYLIMRVRDLMEYEDAWFALKRSLMKGFVTIEEPNAHTQLINAPMLEPQPIPLNVKLVLLGNGNEYWAVARDEDFQSLFKVRAEFSTHMPRTPENEHAYASFLRNRIDDDRLMPFDRAGVAALVEEGSRIADDQDRLSTRFGEIADLAREATYWAKQARRTAVTAADVKTALLEKRSRLNRYEDDVRDYLLRGMYFVATSGVAIGQVNGLSVTDLGEYEFAQPARITARSYVMRSGIGDIDRAVSYTDASHNKGIAILDSYLSGLYSHDQMLTLSANVTFEQSHNHREGDSATCALLVAMLSAVAGLPVAQHYAITGTMDQFGFVRPIGAANVKTEGFFDVCKARGLDGTQGVILPAANVIDLMLRDDVVETVRAGLFKVMSAEHIDDVIEVMFGMPAGARGEDGKFPEGTVHAKVEAALREINDKLDGRKRGKDERDEGDEKKLEPSPEPAPAPEPSPVPPPEPGPPQPEPGPTPPPEPSPGTEQERGRR
jgi:predicted ATP-dependent protease